MEDASDIRDKAAGHESAAPARAGRGLWAALRPAVPAVIGAGALTFLFGALMPMQWVAGIGWNLYLDRLSDLFVPPIGNGARLVLALGMAGVAALIGGIVALLIARPHEMGLARRPRPRAVAADAAAEAADTAPPRRRADRHPDDPPRPPIHAGRDLPAEGLFPTAPTPATGEGAPIAPHGEEEDELVLADLAPVEDMAAGEEPWLQPAAIDAGPALPDPADNSLGAMVARLEAGLARRRGQPAAATPAAPVPDAPVGDAQPDDSEDIDFALEAALGTLQRMNRHATG